MDTCDYCSVHNISVQHTTIVYTFSRNYNTMQKYYNNVLNANSTRRTSSPRAATLSWQEMMTYKASKLGQTDLVFGL